MEREKMTGMEETSPEADQLIRVEKVITEPGAVPILFHEKKQMILKLLISREMTIIDLKKVTGLNPGTVKRHLIDLVDKGLVKKSSMQINKYGVKMKYYRATAKQFTVKLRWP